MKKSEKTIMIIPGAKAQLALANKCHEVGYKIVCVDPNEDAPVLAIADYKEIGDILDRDFCEKIAKNYGVEAIISDECDIAMPTIGYVSDKLGLPSIGAQMASLYTNKYEMRRFCQVRHFPSPRFRKCSNIREAEDFFVSLPSKKMILKPLDSNSSRGVYTITDIQAISEHFNDAVAFSKVDAAVICEEYIEGTEFTVDGVVINGKHRSLAISEKKHYEYNKNIACELFFSTYNPSFSYDVLREQNDKYVEETGLPFGFTHAEYKYNGKEFILIEIGARGGGNYISSHIVPALYNIDYYQMLLDSTFSKEIEDVSEIPNDTEKCVVLKFFDVAKDGYRAIEVENKDILEHNSDVLLHEFRFQSNDIVHRANNDSARVGFYIAQKDSREELEIFMKIIDEQVRIRLVEAN